ncbi:MAG: hypothetical protein AAGA48_27760 [Myxococcota bacterium]
MVLLLTPLAFAQITEVQEHYVEDLPIWIDFADELSPERFGVQSVVDLGSGKRHVTLSVVLRNQEGGHFERAVAVPDFSQQTAFDARTLGAAVFPALTSAGGATPEAASTIDAVVEVGSLVDLDALVDALEQGQVPVRVWAEEVPQLKDDVVLYDWTEADAAAYEVAGNVPFDPFGPPPWDPADTVSMRLFYVLGAPPELLDTDLSTTALYFRPAPGTDLSLLPEGFHYFVAETSEVEDAGSGQFVTLTGRVTDAVDLKNLYAYATFSTSTDGQVGTGPVGGTPIAELDGDEVPLEEREGWSAPFPFNDLSLMNGAINVSGQVHASTLKPSLTLRIRPGGTQLVVRFESEAILAAQLHAMADVQDEDERTLGQTCFPLPDLRFGPVRLPMRLHLEHLLTVEAGLEAGMLLDFQHRVHHAFTVTCFDNDGRGGVCSHDSEMTSHPLQITPPQLTPTLGAFAQVGTQLDATLWIGGPRWPECATGSRVMLTAGLFGRLDVQPLKTPWFAIRPGHTLEGTLALDILGESIAEYPLGGVLEFHPDALLSALEVPDPLALNRFTSGGDLRWMVVFDQIDVANPTVERVTATTLPNGALALTSEGPGDHRLWILDSTCSMNESFGAGLQTEFVTHSPDNVVVLSDETHLVGGAPSWMGVFEPDNDLLWARSYEVTDGDRPFTAEINGLEKFGEDGVFWLGHLARGPQDDAIIARLTEAGDIVWAKIYEGDGRQQLHAATETSDGDLVVVGTTEHGPDPFSLDNAWIMRIEPGNGEVVWSYAIVSTRRLGRLFDVEEAADGAFVAVGSAVRDVTRTGASFVVRVEPDGSSAIHAMLVATDGEVWVDELPVPFLPQVYDTAYDTLTTLAVVEDSVVVAGHAGNDVRTAWMASLGSRLEPEWFATLDSDGNEAFTDVHATPEGLIVAGYTTATVAGNDGTDRLPFVAKVPFGGGLPLAEDIDALRFDYRMPGVRDTSGSPDIVPSEQVLFEAPVTVVDATVRTITELDAEDLLRPTPERVCAHLLTVTGRPTTTDACADVDRLPPVVRIVSPAPGSSWAAEAPIPIEVVLTDEFGLTDSTLRIDGTDLDVTGPIVNEAVRLETGTHWIEAEAEDAAGFVSRAVVEFDVHSDSKDEPDGLLPTSEPARCGCATPAPGAGLWILLLIGLVRRRGKGLVAACLAFGCSAGTNVDRDVMNVTYGSGSTTESSTDTGNGKPVPLPPGWQPTMDLGSGWEPSVAMDASGNGAIVFNTDSDPDPISFDDHIGVVRYSGGSFRALELIEDLSFNSVRPRIAMTGSGRAMALWRDTAVEASLYTPGAGWQGQTLLDEGSNFNVSLVANEDGQVIAGWTRNPDLTYPVSKGWRSVYDPGGAQWSSPEVLETDDSGDGLAPVFAIDAVGNGVAVWFQHRAVFADSGLYHSIYDVATATWSAPVLSPDSFGHEPQEAGMRSDGSAVVAVLKQGVAGNADSVEVYAYNATLDAWDDLEAPKRGNQDARVPQLAIDGLDNVFVAWLEEDGGLWDVYANRYDHATGTWGASTLLEEDQGSAQVVVNGLDVAADAGGNAMVVWSQNVAASSIEFRIRAAHFDPTKGWGLAEQIDQSGIGDGSVEPQVAMSATGEALVVWQTMPEPSVGAAVYVAP